MGWAPTIEVGMRELPLLFDAADLPIYPLTPEKNFKSFSIQSGQKTRQDSYKNIFGFLHLSPSMVYT